MINKSFWATNDALAVKAWEEKLYRELVIESYFDKFTSTSGESIVHQKTKIGKGMGDTVTFGLMKALKGEGQESANSDFTLLGKGESLATASDSLTLKEVGHSVVGRNPMSEQRVLFSINAEAEASIKTWAVEKLDKQHFEALFGTAFNKSFYAGTATSVATLTSGMKLTPQLLSKVKAWAKTGGSRAQMPIKPVRVSGKNYYVALLHPYVLFDLKQDATFQQWMREAEVRGKENPLFSGAVAMVDGLVIHDHERVPLLRTGGSGAVPYARNVLLGQQALAIGWGQKIKVEQEVTDFKRFSEYGVTWINGVKRVAFESKDYGAIEIVSAVTDIDA